MLICLSPHYFQNEIMLVRVNLLVSIVPSHSYISPNYDQNTKKDKKEIYLANILCLIYQDEDM